MPEADTDKQGGKGLTGSPNQGDSFANDQLQAGRARLSEETLRKQKSVIDQLKQKMQTSDAGAVVDPVKKARAIGQRNLQQDLTPKLNQLRKSDMPVGGDNDLRPEERPLDVGMATKNYGDEEAVKRARDVAQEDVLSKSPQLSEQSRAALDKSRINPNQKFQNVPAVQKARSLAEGKQSNLNEKVQGLFDKNKGAKEASDRFKKEQKARQPIGSSLSNKSAGQGGDQGKTGADGKGGSGAIGNKVSGELGKQLGGVDGAAAMDIGKKLASGDIGGALQGGAKMGAGILLNRLLDSCLLPPNLAWSFGLTFVAANIILIVAWIFKIEVPKMRKWIILGVDLVLILLITIQVVLLISMIAFTCDTLAVKAALWLDTLGGNVPSVLAWVTGFKGFELIKPVCDVMAPLGQ